jgi:hypothetical protein
VDDVDLIIDRARRQDAGSGDDRELHRLVAVVDPLIRGGLGYAMDHLRARCFVRGGEAADRLGADDLSRALAAAADIAETRRGFGLDRAIADWDAQHRPLALAGALRAAVSARLRQDATAFSPVHHS